MSDTVDLAVVSHNGTAITIAVRKPLIKSNGVEINADTWNMIQNNFTRCVNPDEINGTPSYTFFDQDDRLLRLLKKNGYEPGKHKAEYDLRDEIDEKLNKRREKLAMVIRQLQEDAVNGTKKNDGDIITQIENKMRAYRALDPKWRWNNE